MGWRPNFLVGGRDISRFQLLGVPRWYSVRTARILFDIHEVPLPKKRSGATISYLRVNDISYECEEGHPMRRRT